MTTHAKIRLADREDLEPLVAMARKFWKYTVYDEPFDSEHAMTMLVASLDQELLVVLEVDGSVEGSVCGIYAPLMGSSGAKQAVELGYWINPEHRGSYGTALLDSFEAAARRVGVKYLNMIAMESSNPRPVEELYLKRGYKKIETTYLKILEA